MIRFFQKIRQRLAAENKIIQYLTYALGEIVLVVIGILIALAINNWNQEKKNNELGTELLVRIHDDLVQDTLYFRSNIIRNDKVREDIKVLLVKLYDGVETVEEVQQMSSTWDLALDQTFSPNDNTYRSMISSGTLGLIGNQELKEQIIDLYSDYEQNRALLTAIGQWMIGIASAMDTSTDFIKFNSEVSDIFTTLEMFNEADFAYLQNKEDPRFKLTVRAISAAAFNQKVNNEFQLRMIQKCDAVLQLINHSIK